MDGPGTRISPANSIAPSCRKPLRAVRQQLTRGKVTGRAKVRDGVQCGDGGADVWQKFAGELTLDRFNQARIGGLFGSRDGGGVERPMLTSVLRLLAFLCGACFFLAEIAMTCPSRPVERGFELACRRPVKLFASVHGAPGTNSMSSHVPC
jgi:hypothetical protein